MDDAELQARADEHVWFHSIELRPGVVTKGGKTPEVLGPESAALLDPLRLDGRTLLDIGAWNGFYSFAAKRRGARRVKAIDYHTWRNPHFRGRETFELARRALGLDIETQEMDATELSGAFGQFDAILFLGVFYHLLDPIPVITALREMALGVVVIETHQDALDQERPMMVFYPGTTLAGDPSNWWGPNIPLMYELLKEAGFGRILYRDHPVYGRQRGMYHAFISEEARRALSAGHQGWTDLSVETDRRALKL